MKDKITHTPWHLDKEQGGNQWAIIGDNTATAFIPAQHKHAELNAAAIVSAVNNTYGIGIDPAMIPSVMEDLKTIIDTGHLVTREAIITLVRYCIQKSKL